ncbi:hypothetical protein RB195_000149 [Necator americanus]|uniref:Uncharacterized protein n=1 Tax=Necator americanus TaxID=51031 RepID=A0ABR1D9W1_NECAM
MLIVWLVDNIHLASIFKKWMAKHRQICFCNAIFQCILLGQDFDPFQLSLIHPSLIVATCGELRNVPTADKCSDCTDAFNSA